MKKLFRILYRLLILLPAVAFQVIWIWLLINILDEYQEILQGIVNILQILFIIYLFNKRDETNYKMLWCILILAVPFVGVWLYILAGDHKTSKNIEKLIDSNLLYINTQNQNQHNDSTLSFVQNFAHMEVKDMETFKYYPLGDMILQDMLEDLKNAKHFIFLEYFIIEKGIFWNSIVDILKQKVKEGVIVKIMYDDIGSIATYSLKSRNDLRKAGIDIVSFNPVVSLKLVLNNRDHRKMMIIDNKICYSGGINIADEYINKKHPYGHWKDIGFRMTGNAVSSYTHIFLLFWNAYSKNKIYEKNLFKPEYKTTNTSVLTYYDSPHNVDSISNNYFIHELFSATNYIYFYSPYLILNDSLKNAFIQAAKRNVDVRIIIPGIPDKKTPYALALKNAYELTKYGVKVYVYKKGFVHAKALVSDNSIASIGTVNLDYRSLYLHYENNTIFTSTEVINQVKDDMKSTMKDCTLLVPKKLNIFKKIAIAFLNLISPLM